MQLYCPIKKSVEHHRRQVPGLSVRSHEQNAHSDRLHDPEEHRPAVFY